jgi:hypothetical protein
MTACNAHPPEGHPFHGTLVACHFRAGHLGPHAFDITPTLRAGATHRLPIDVGATVGDLCELIDGLPADAQVRGSVVVWIDDEPVKVIGLAPEYEDG